MESHFDDDMSRPGSPVGKDDVSPASPSPLLGAVLDGELPPPPPPPRFFYTNEAPIEIPSDPLEALESEEDVFPVGSDGKDEEDVFPVGALGKNEEDIYPTEELAIPTSSVAKLFLASPAALEFLPATTQGETTLLGAATTFDELRVRLARARSCASSLGELPTGDLSVALATLQERARLFQPAVDFASDAELHPGWDLLNAAAQTSDATRRAQLATSAQESLLQASKRVANERSLCALCAAALAQSYSGGDLPSALTILDALVARPFKSSESSDPKPSFCRYLQFQIEARDLLAQLSGSLVLAALWREKSLRFRELASTSVVERENAASLRQAFNLYLATSLLPLDLRAGYEALKAAAHGGDPDLNQEFIAIYKATFQTPTRRPKPARPAKFDLVLKKTTKAGARLKFAIRDVKLTFRYCPPGVFTMGSPVDEALRASDERRRQVELTQGFWILETPVTQAIWQATLGSNPSSFSATGADADDVVGLDASKFPVENVSWLDCQTFINTLNNHRALPPGYAFRLPTEAEWEYAARSGAAGPYAGYDSLNSIAWRLANSEYRVRETKTKAPNAWGISDMLGNVYEWCEDWYGDYSGLTAVDPKGPETGSERVVRGGCWFSIDAKCRCAARDKRPPAHSDNCCGFRLVFARVS